MLFRSMQDATFVPVAFDAGTYEHEGITLPAVDALAFRDTAGGLWLALVNLDPDSPSTVSINVEGLAVSQAAGQVLTAANVNSINTFAAPETVAPAPISGAVRNGVLQVELPGKSVAVLALTD